MAKIAILNDSPEIVALMAQALSPAGHALMKMVESSSYMADQVQAFAPDVIIIPIHRRQESLNRPIANYRADIRGSEVLELVCSLPTLQQVPIILFGFYTSEADLPDNYRAGIRYDAFLEFPLGIQELNPLITGILRCQAAEE